LAGSVWSIGYGVYAKGSQMESTEAELQQMFTEVQEENRRLKTRYHNKLEVNHAINRTLVSFQGNKSEAWHRWFKYKEGFSASLVEYLMDTLHIDTGPLLDPFAGSGTALFTASDRGLDTIGIELLPVAAEIIRTRDMLRSCDSKSVAKRVLSYAEKGAWKQSKRRREFCHLRITADAFPPETQAALERYLYSAQTVKDIVLKQILRFAALCILESVSYTRKDGQYLRWDSRSSRRLRGKEFHKGPIIGFDDAICAKLREIAGDLTNNNRGLFEELMQTNKPGSVELREGSCLDLLPEIPTASIGAIITSPPYCNRYDYTRTYALELAMLGVDEEELRRFRQAMLCCTVENREKDWLVSRFKSSTLKQVGQAFDSQKVLNTALAYLESCRLTGAINNNSIPRMVKNYFKELAIVIFECARVLKPGHPFIMVNDNVRYQGAEIPVDLILSDFAERAGFDTETIWVLPRGKGNSSQQMGIHGRMENRKCVYVWRLRGRQAKQRARKAALAQSCLPRM